MKSPAKDSPAETLPSVFQLRVERRAAATSSELRCETQRKLLETLRAVGRYFYDRKTRRHLEWVWDGECLWIVQNDEAPEQKGASPEPHLPPSTRPVQVKRLRLFRPFTAKASLWQKLQCVCDFKSAGLPTAQLFVLKGKSALLLLAKGRTPKRLRSDLAELTASPLIIRSDIRGETTLFAKHTTGLTNPSVALDFLKRTTREFVASGVKPDHICFIAHRFIPASASAFSLARPASPRVRIDALWGLPDGLEFCPHDSFEIDSRSGIKLAKRIRYKPKFLAVLPSEDWSIEELGAPWDWKAALDDDTLREIAKRKCATCEETAEASCNDVVRERFL